MSTLLCFCFSFKYIFRTLLWRLLFSFLLPFSQLQSKKEKSDQVMTLSISCSSSHSAMESFFRPPGIQQIWLMMESGVQWLPRDSHQNRFVCGICPSVVITGQHDSIILFLKMLIFVPSHFNEPLEKKDTCRCPFVC